MIAFRNLYKNLPGHLVEFKDGGLALKNDPNPPTTGSLLILGTAIDGPILEPIAVDPSTASLLFGSAINNNGVPNGSTLIPAFEEAYQAGCRDIRLMRVSGEYASTSIVADDNVITTQKLKNQQLGQSTGNSETEITLANSPLVDASVVVTASGVQLLTGVSVDNNDGIVVIAEDSCNGGAAINVSYDYYETITEAVNVEAGLIATLTYGVNDIITIKKAGVDVTATYDIVDNVITFDAGGDVEEDDTLDLVYVSNNEISVIESSSGGVPFKAASELVEKDLSEDPVAGTIHLYGDGAEILTVGAYSIIGIPGNRKVSLNTAKIPMDVTLELSYAYNDTETITPTIVFTSLYGGEVYNQANVSVEDILDEDDVVIGKSVLLTKPEAKKAQIAEEPLAYSSLDYPTFSQLISAINADEDNNVFSATTAYNASLTSTLSLNGGSYLLGGLSGLDLTTQEMYEALVGTRDSYGLLTKQGAFQLLENYNTDWVVPVGVYADDELSGKYDNFAYQLALFCAVLSYRSKMTFGAIGMKPITETSLSALQEYGRYLTNYNNHYYMIDSAGNILKDGDTGEEMDLGGFINVVAGPEIQVRGTSLGLYYTNPAVVYAAYSTTLNPQSSTANKNLSTALNVRYRLSDAQLNDIVGNRFTILKRKFNGNVSVVQDITAAKTGSDYAYRTTGKVVRVVTDEIREVCDPFLHEPNTKEQRNAMSASIGKRLDELKKAQIIQRAEFTVVATVVDEILGKAKIELTIVPPQELRQITTVVSLSAV